jgi:hypothetical protein
MTRPKDRSSTTATYEVIIWNRAAPDPVFVVLLPLKEGGTRIAHRGGDGLLYGCRDVAAGERHEEIVQAWLDGDSDPARRRDATLH